MEQSGQSPAETFDVHEAYSGRILRETEPVPKEPVPAPREDLDGVFADARPLLLSLIESMGPSYNRETSVTHGACRIEVRVAHHQNVNVLQTTLFAGDAKVGELHMHVHDGAWNIKHRIVQEKFREQGVMSKWIKMVENLAEARAAQEGKNITLYASMGQPELMAYFAKRGFAPKEEDRELYDRILEGDDSIICSAAWDLVKGGEPRFHSSTLYCFDKSEVIDRAGQIDEEALRYHLSLRVTMEKVIRPDVETKVEKGSAETRDALKNSLRA